MRFYHLTWIAVLASTLDYRFFADNPGMMSVSLFQVVTMASIFSYGAIAATRPAAMQHTGVLLREGRWTLLCFLSAGLAATWGMLHAEYQSAIVLRDLLPSLLLFVLVIQSVQSRADLYGLLAAYKLGMIIEVAIGVSQSFFGAPRIVSLNEATLVKTDLTGAFVGDPELLPAGLFSHPNALALILIPFVLLLLADLYHQPRRKVGRWLAGIFLLAVLGFVFWRCYSKGAYAWVLIGTVLVLLPPMLFRFRFGLAWLMLFVGIVGLTAFSIQAEIGTVVSRYQLWQAAYAALHDPMVLLLGNGDSAMLVQSSLFSNMTYPSSHNTFVDLVIVFGLPAFLFYCMTAFKSIRDAARLTTQLHARDRSVAVFLHAGLVSFLGACFFEPGLFGTMFQAQFFLLAAFTVALSQITSSDVANISSELGSYA